MNWNNPQVYRQGVMKAYVDEYPNHAFGILQEDSQNGFDAYPRGTLPKNMKIEFKYDANNRVLYYRDYGTIGMTHCRECDWGIRSDGNPCMNKECGWGCFHNLAISGKSGFSLGSRGLGKSLRLESGERTIVNTTLPDGRSMASEWQIVDGDWKWRKAPELAKELSSSGTEMITYGIKKNVHDQLIQPKEVIKFLQDKWFKLIEQGAKILYILEEGTEKKRYIIPKLKLPEIQESEPDKPAILKKSHIIIKFKGKRIGELRNLELYLTKEMFDSNDPRWGIAIVKNGKQTITRYRDFPYDIPENLRRRIFGSVDADCEREQFLNEAENSTHTGYQYQHPVYKAVRLELNRIVKEFIEPFIRAGGEKVTKKEQQEGQEILKVVNATLAKIPELKLFGQSGSGVSGTVETKPKDHPYISRLEPNNERFNKGDVIRTKAVIKNPLDKEMMVIIDFNLYDPTPVVIRDGTSWVLLRSGTPEDPFTIEERWDINVDDSMVPGIHWIQVELKDKDENPIVDSNGKPQKKRASIHIEHEPMIIQRKSRTGSKEPKTDHGTRGGEGEGGFACFNWFKKPELPDFEVQLDTARAYVFVNKYGRRYKFISEGSQKAKTPWLAVAEAIAEKLVEKKIERDLEEGSENLTIEEVKTKFKELDGLKTKFIKTFLEELL